MPRPVKQIGEFVGKPRIVARLIEQQQGALHLHQPMPHVLLVGVPGIGKSLLARTLAERAGVKLLSFYAGESGDEFEKRLRGLQPYDYLTIDEAHMLPPRQQYRLLDVLADFRLPPDATTPAELPRDDSGRIVVEKCTIIFATNYPDQLLNDLLDRIPITEELSYYSVRELREISRTYVSQRGMLVKPQALTLIGRAASGVPRQAKHMVASLHRHLVHRSVLKQRPGPDVVPVNSAQVSNFFRHNDIHIVADSHDPKLYCGLGPPELRYLKYLFHHEHMSLKQMSKLTGIAPQRLDQHVERLLVRCGLIEIESRGRTVTCFGRQWLTQILSSNANRRRERSHASQLSNEEVGEALT